MAQIKKKTQIQKILKFENDPNLKITKIKKNTKIKKRKIRNYSNSKMTQIKKLP